MHFDKLILVTALFFACFNILTAQNLERQTGPIIEEYGSVWAVPNPDFITDTEQTYQVIFDIHSSAEDPGQLNASLNTLARYLNMHAQAGVPIENIQVVGVIHNKASTNALDDEAYRKRFGIDNPNAPLIKALTEAGAKIYMCGQSIYSRKLEREHILPSIEVGLSAMTVILSYTREGYQLIKF